MAETPRYLLSDITGPESWRQVYAEAGTPAA